MVAWARPGVGRFVAGLSCLRRGPPQAAAGAVVPFGVRASRAGRQAARRHAPHPPARGPHPGPVRESADSPTWPSPAPRLGLRRDISGAYVALGRVRAWAAKGKRVSGGRPTPGLRGFAGAIVAAPSGPSRPDKARPRGAPPRPLPRRRADFTSMAPASSDAAREPALARRLVLGPPQPPALSPLRPSASEKNKGRERSPDPPAPSVLQLLIRLPLALPLLGALRPSRSGELCRSAPLRS